MKEQRDEGQWRKRRPKCVFGEGNVEKEWKSVGNEREKERERGVCVAASGKSDARAKERKRERERMSDKGVPAARARSKGGTLASERATTEREHRGRAVPPREDHSPEASGRREASRAQAQ